MIDPIDLNLKCSLAYVDGLVNDPIPKTSTSLILRSLLRGFRIKEELEKPWFLKINCSSFEYPVVCYGDHLFTPEGLFISAQGCGGPFFACRYPGTKCISKFYPERVIINYRFNTATIFARDVTASLG